MDTAYIISKMNEFMFRLSERMGKWLNKRLSGFSTTRSTPAVF